MSGRSKPFDVDRLERTLLPCPFCGNVAVLIYSQRIGHHESYLDDTRYWYVRCVQQTCLCYKGTGKFADSPETPVKIWNRRHHG